MNFTTMQDNFPRIFRPSVEEFKAVGEDVPFVITGLVTEWPAYTKWTTDYLKEKYGDEVGKALITNQKIKAALNNNKPMTFRSYIENVIEKKTPANDDFFYYMVLQSNSSLLPWKKWLDNYYDVPEYIKGKKSIKGFWFSGDGAYTYLHYDIGHNLLGQVKGQKRIIIYPPNLSCLYYDPETYKSAVDIMNPDYTKFPNFKFAQPLMCVLKAGEMLYLPSCWWHHVISEEPVNISLNFFSRPSVRYSLRYWKYIKEAINLRSIKLLLKN